MIPYTELATTQSRPCSKHRLRLNPSLRCRAEPGHFSVVIDNTVVPVARTSAPRLPVDRLAFRRQLATRPCAGSCDGFRCHSGSLSQPASRLVELRLAISGCLQSGSAELGTGSAVPVIATASNACTPRRVVSYV